jgi:hypothetical protein
MFFFLPALPSLFSLLFLGWLICVGGLPEKSGPTLLMLFVLCASILFWFLLSRGLRYCSRGWCVCALVIILLSFIDVIVEIIRFLITRKLPHHETPSEFWAGYGIGFLLLLWQYSVLTRPDVRKLFYPSMRKRNDAHHCQPESA